MSERGLIPGPEDGARFGFDHARLFHSRSRSRSHRDVVRGLFRSRRIEIADTVPTNTFQAADLTSPVTFHTRIRVDGATPSGSIFHVGSSSLAVTAWTVAGFMIAAAGRLDDPIPNDGALAFTTFNAVAGVEMDVVVSVSPGSGVLTLWCGDSMQRVQSADAGGFISGQWGDLDEMKFGTDVAAPPTLTAGSFAAPSDFSVIAPLSIFLRQLPRHFIAKRF